MYWEVIGRPFPGIPKNHQICPLSPLLPDLTGVDFHVLCSASTKILPEIL